MNRNYLQTSTHGIVRDKRTGALINMNDAELDLYLAERKRHYDYQQITDEIDSIKENMSEIRMMLGMLLERTNNVN